MANGKVTTVKFDAKTEERITNLKRAYPGASNSDIIRLALQVLDKARTAQAENSDLAIVDRQLQASTGVKRFILPFEDFSQDAD